jgi:hypothetical protein
MQRAKGLGTQCIRFTSTTVQILTAEVLSAPPRHMTTLEAERAKQQGGEEAGTASSSSKVAKVDGKRTVEYCVVLENMALLYYSRSLGLGTQFTRFTSTKVQLLTQKALHSLSKRNARVSQDHFPGWPVQKCKYWRSCWYKSTNTDATRCCRLCEKRASGAQCNCLRKSKSSASRCLV